MGLTIFIIRLRKKGPMEKARVVLAVAFKIPFYLAQSNFGLGLQMVHCTPVAMSLV